ncbi:MAG: pilus assembly protein [Acidobacteria bacterium]|nr:pilus assembly protein [Acidobacteriota bacterium]
MQRANQPSRRRRQGGSTITEFAVVFPFMVAAFFGSVGMGVTMIRYMQAVQVCRDLAHMYADGVDFTQTMNKNIAVKLAEGTGMTTNGGNGVVVFSKVLTVFESDCDAAGLSTCGNENQAVVFNRQTVGNTALLSSQFASPSPSSIMDAEGDISAANYLNANSSVRAPLLTTLLTAAGTAQLQGDVANITELYFLYPDISFLGGSTPAGVYMRFVY